MCARVHVRVRVCASMHVFGRAYAWIEHCASAHEECEITVTASPAHTPPPLGPKTRTSSNGERTNKTDRRTELKTCSFDYHLSN